MGASTRTTMHLAIGGGPLALAVACRYNEQSPSWKRTLNVASCTCERCKTTMRGREALLELSTSSREPDPHGGMAQAAKS